MSANFVHTGTRYFRFWLIQGKNKPRFWCRGQTEPIQGQEELRVWLRDKKNQDLLMQRTRFSCYIDKTPDFVATGAKGNPDFGIEAR